MRHRIQLALFACMLSSMLVSCGPSRFVRPLKEGHTTFQVSTGYLPFDVRSNRSSDELSNLSVLTGASFGWGTGISDNVTGWGAFYPIFLLGGALYGELGAVAGVLTPIGEGPGVSVASHLHAGKSFSGGIFGGGSDGSPLQLLSQFDATAYYEFASARPYIGVTTILPLMIERSESFTIVPAAIVGITLKSRRTELTFELKSSFFTFDFDHTNPGWYGIGISIAGR